jgi:hypothetical protein
MAGLTKNAGAFATWDHATQPFTSGSPIGLCKFYDAATAAAKVHAYVTAETLWVFIETNTGTVFGCGIGALLDPESSSSNSAESDGRLYSVAVTGTTALGTNMNTAATFPAHTTSNNAVHWLTLQPGSSSCLRTARLHTQSASTTSTLINRDSEPVALPIYCIDSANDKFLGRLREITAVRDAKLGQRQSPAGTDRWHYVGGAVSSDADCIGFLV